MSEQQEVTTIEDCDVQQFRETFDMFDKNKDGTITVEEFGTVCKCLGQNPTEQQIKAMISAADMDGNGCINFQEFIKMVNAGKPQTKEEREAALRDAFKVFDRNKNGFISVRELRKIMKNVGECLTEDELEQMIAVADVNKDGKIDYEEFVKTMMS